MQPFYDVDTTVAALDADRLVISRVQDIPDEFMESLKSERLAMAAVRLGEHHHVASVPAAVFDMWAAQGLEPYSMTPREIVARLRRDNLEAFITTNRKV